MNRSFIAYNQAFDKLNGTVRASLKNLENLQKDKCGYASVNTILKLGSNEIRATVKVSGNEIYHVIAPGYFEYSIGLCKTLKIDGMEINPYTDSSGFFVKINVNSRVMEYSTNQSYAFGQHLIDDSGDTMYLTHRNFYDNYEQPINDLGRILIVKHDVWSRYPKSIEQYNNWYGSFGIPLTQSWTEIVNRSINAIDRLIQ